MGDASYCGLCLKDSLGVCQKGAGESGRKISVYDDEKDENMRSGRKERLCMLAVQIKGKVVRGVRRKTN